jgi:hypothetical protein
MYVGCNSAMVREDPRRREGTRDEGETRSREKKCGKVKKERKASKGKEKKEKTAVMD